jgi:hypothetical protein
VAAVAGVQADCCGMTSGEEGLCFPAGCMYAEGAVCSLMSALAVGCCCR